MKKLLITAMLAVASYGCVPSYADHMSEVPLSMPFTENENPPCNSPGEMALMLFHLGYKIVKDSPAGAMLYHEKTGNFIFVKPNDRGWLCIAAVGNPHIEENQNETN